MIIGIYILAALIISYMVFNYLSKISRKKSNTLDNAKKDYLQFLGSFVLGAGTDETSREFCKIKQMWEIAETPSDLFAVFQLSDAISSLAFDDAVERLDTEGLEEISKVFRHKRDYLLWSIIRFSQKKNNKHGKTSKEELNSFCQKSIEKSKREMGIRYCHFVKSYPRPWENS